MSKAKKIDKKNLGRCFKYFSKFAFETNKTFYFWLIFDFVVGIIAPFISIIGTEKLVTEIAPGGLRRTKYAIIWILVICVGTYLATVIKKAAEENKNRINENFYRILSTRISMSSIQMKFANTEDTKVLDIITNAERALNDSGHVNGLITPIFSVIQNIVIALGVIVLVATRVPWLIIPIVFSFVVNYVMSRWINKVRRKYFDQVGGLERGSSYYNTELMEPRYAKDIRIYNADDVFVEKYENFMDKLYKLAKVNNLKLLSLISSNVALRNLATGFMYVLTGIYALKKWITIGTFVALSQASDKFNRSLWDIIDSYMSLSYTISILGYYIDFMEQVYVDKKLEEYHVEKQDCKIEFKNVSFKYPNTDRYILKNISTVINKGEHLSIVGKNGAGKTTFIKLLCKLYDNYEGEILINDKSIKDMKFEEYVELLSVIFQDFRLFAFKLKENINIFREGDMDLEYVYRTCGIKDWIDSLPNKDDTYIYKMFEEDGVEPSGGQGQKMAIARALYKNAPIVVLDEPTAALDPIAENEIYMNFDKLVKGKTAIYISHRLSSCKFCDRIIVFEGGSIIEEGTHDELMAIEEGFYANMFNTQANQYAGAN